MNLQVPQFVLCEQVKAVALGPVSVVFVLPPASWLYISVKYVVTSLQKESACVHPFWAGVTQVTTMK